MIIDIKCSYCGRWLGNTEKSVEIKTLKCSSSKCKKDNYIKITLLTDTVTKKESTNV